VDSDAVLLEQYARSSDAEASAEPVRRHSRLVYATALRIVGSEHDAEVEERFRVPSLFRKPGSEAAEGLLYERSMASGERRGTPPRFAAPAQAGKRTRRRASLRRQGG